MHPDYVQMPSADAVLALDVPFADAGAEGTSDRRNFEQALQNDLALASGAGSRLVPAQSAFC